MRQTGVVLSGLVALGGSRLVAVWAIARWQGAAVQGSFALALSCIAFATPILTCGFEYANAYFVGRARRPGPNVVANTLAMAAIALVIAPLWTAGFSKVFPQMLAPASGSALLAGGLISIGTALFVLLLSLQAVGVGRQDFGGVAVTNAVYGGAWALLALGAARVSYVALVAAWCVALGIGCAWYLRAERVGAGTVRAFDRILLREQVGYGARLVPGAIARGLNIRAGLYLCTFYLAPSDVGVYALLLSLSEAMLYFTNAVCQVVLGTSATGGGGTRRHAGAYATVLALGICATVVTATLGSRLLALVFGGEYARGAGALAVLFAAVTMHSVGLLRAHDLMGRGAPTGVSVAQIVGLVLTLGAGVALVPRFGLVGASTASLVAYAGFAIATFASGAGAGLDAASPPVVPVSAEP